MIRFAQLLVFVILLAATETSARRFSKDKDAVRLESIKALTFQKDKDTTHRRVSALPQLSCIGGSGCQYFQPESVRCVNSGSSYDASSIEWTCTASLPPEVKLGSTDVVCEGYDNPDDDYVLKGSCALEYRLLLTDIGVEKFGKQSNTRWFGDDDGGNGEGGNGFLAPALFWLLFCSVAGWILYSLWRNTFHPERNHGGPRNPNRGGWGGGWDDDGNDDPPPPYSPFGDDYSGPSAKARSSPRTYTPRNPRTNQAGSNRASSSHSADAQQQRGGSWWQNMGSAAAGGAAGYMAANARNSQRERDLRQREERLGMRERQGQGSWLSGILGGQGGRAARDQPAAPRGSAFGGGSSFTPQRSSSSSFGNSVSSERQESTGFGGTRRR